VVLHDVENPFGQFGPTVPAVSSLSFLPTPSLPREAGGGQVEKKRKLWALCKHCSAVAETWMCHQCCFGQKSKT